MGKRPMCLSAVITPEQVRETISETLRRKMPIDENTRRQILSILRGQQGDIRT